MHWEHRLGELIKQLEDSVIGRFENYIELVYIHTKHYLCGIISQKEVYNRMLIIDSKDCENIDKALKKYKKKFEKSKTLLQLRERQSFTKPSVVRRTQVLKAIYKQQIASGKIEA